MAKQKQSFITGPLKAYLEMKIAKAGATPVALESERELTKNFRLSRPTVHQAMEELLQDGWCLKLPGKQAMYSNPERYTPEIRNVGILFGDLCSLSYCDLTFIGSLFHALDDHRTFVHFIRLYSTSMEKDLLDLKNIGLDGILFCSFDSQTMPLAKQLIREGIPVVAVAGKHHTDRIDLPDDHCVQYSQKDTIRYRVDLIEKLGFRKILLCSDRGTLDIHNSFNKVQIDPKRLLSTKADIRRRLPAQLRSYRPDVIIADGPSQIYYELFDVLSHCPGELPSVMVDSLAKSCIPDLEKKFKIICMDCSFLDEKRGRDAAEKLNILMDRKQKR